MSHTETDYQPRRITDETVEHLRQGGASDDLLAFARRHVARYSDAQMDKAKDRFFWLGVFVGVGVTLFIAAVRP